MSNPQLATLVQAYRAAENADAETQEAVAADLMQALAYLHPAGDRPEFCEPEAHGGVLVYFADGSSICVNDEEGILLVDD